MAEGFITSDSVSLLNGSKIVTVTGNNDLNYVSSGTAVFINGILFEGVEGTVADGGGTSTLTLRNTYTGPNITGGSMTVFNTLEGLRDAIRKARDITINAATLQQSFGEVLTSTESVVKIDINGVETDVVPYQYLANQLTGLLGTAQDVSDDMAAVEGRLTTAEGTLSTIESTLEDKATRAEDSEAKAKKWAEEDEDVVVETGQYSSKHHALKSAEDAQQVSSDKGIVEGYKNTAESAAQTATTKAGEADTSAQTASQAAATATTKAGEADADAQQTAADRSAVATDKGIVEGYKTSAEAAAQTATTKAGEADTSATTATQAKNISMANAAFKGLWSDQTGPAAPPYSVRDGSATYMLQEAIADVTLSQPSVDTDKWFVTSVIGGNAPDSDRLGGELPSHYFSQDNYPADLKFNAGAVTVAARDNGLSVVGPSNKKVDIIHNGSNAYIENMSEGVFYIRNGALGQDMIFSVDTDAGNIDHLIKLRAGTNDNESYVELLYGDSTRLVTSLEGVNVTGELSEGGERVFSPNNHPTVAQVQEGSGTLEQKLSSLDSAIEEAEALAVALSF